MHPSSKPCFICVPELLKPFLILLIISQLPKLHRLEQDFRIGLEHLLSLPQLVRECPSIRFNFFLCDVFDKIDELEHKAGLFNGEEVLVRICETVDELG